MALGHAGDKGADHGAARLLERLPETIAGYLPRGGDTGGEGNRRGPLGHSCDRARNRRSWQEMHPALQLMRFWLLKKIGIDLAREAFWVMGDLDRAIDLGGQ